MSKKFFTPGREKHLKISSPNNTTTESSSIFSNKPFILREIQSRTDAETYRALRTIFSNNRTVTYTLAKDLDMLDDVLHDFIPSLTSTIKNSKTTTNVYKTSAKRSRYLRKERRTAKMWKPE